MSFCFNLAKTQSCHQGSARAAGQDRCHMSHLLALSRCTREEWLLVRTGPTAQGTGGPGFLGLTFVFGKDSATQIL